MSNITASLYYSGQEYLLENKEEILLYNTSDVKRNHFIVQLSYKNSLEF